MSFEFDYDLLETTMNEIEEMDILQEKKYELESEKYECISDFDEAYQNAFHRTFAYEEFPGHSWVDILESNMAVVKKIVYEQDNYAELNKEIRKIEVPDIEIDCENECVEEEILSELRLCLVSRFVCGKSNEFFEKLYAAYKAGGWPCGWNNGKMIVFFHEDKYMRNDICKL